MNWIKVKDRLPNIGEMVHIKFNSFIIEDVLFTKRGEGYEFRKRSGFNPAVSYILDATHWMPLLDLPNR